MHGFRERLRQQLMAEFGADPVAPDFTDLLGMFSGADFERAERELFPDGGVLAASMVRRRPICGGWCRTMCTYLLLTVRTEVKDEL